MFWQEVAPKPGASADEVNQLASHPAVLPLPRAAMFLASVTNILAESMGFRQSLETGKGRFGDGSPAPIMSYALLEYVQGLDLRDCDVLELGGGESTSFWARRARSVVTLETNPQWVGYLRQNNPSVTVEQIEEDQFAPRIAAFDRRFDIIVIDPAANRARCARAAIAKVAEGGFIILDNSEWYPNACRLLREADLVQVDFHDFRPLHHFRATTSLFLTSQFRARPLQDRLPLPPVGGKPLPTSGPAPWDVE